MLTRHRFTTAEYEQMVRTGILTKDDRVELLRGEVVRMTPIGARHAESVRRIMRLLVQEIGDLGIISVQSPVHLDDRSMPEPDVAVLKARPGGYAEAHPTPPDILLLVEVADTSLLRDRELKIPLYAQAGIAETWLVDLTNQVVEVHQRPGRGGYRKVRRLTEGELVVPGVEPGIELCVDTFLL